MDSRWPEPCIVSSCIDRYEHRPEHRPADRPEHRPEHEPEQYWHKDPQDMNDDAALYRNPAAMEPLYPRDPKSELEKLAIQIIHKAGKLSAVVHSITRESIVEVVRSMNSYYSNLIEGHNTHPLDIEKALHHDYSDEPAKRALQIESQAHINVQRRLTKAVRDFPETPICTASFLCRIHREFYAELPDEFRNIKLKSGKPDRVIPGELRTREVEVGRHIAPAHDALPAFLSRFEEAYEPKNLKGLRGIVAAAASHHRLAWIHPFLDGNGRVTRLFTDIYFIKLGVDSNGLWTVSRGLSRKRSDYLAALASADRERQNDTDGRGNLSEAALLDFSKFFLEIVIDQIRYMSSLLDLDSMEERIIALTKRWVRETNWNLLESKIDRVARLLIFVYLRGELPRGEAAAILSMPERTARRVLT